MYSLELHILKIICGLASIYRIQWLFDCLLGNIFLYFSYFALLVYSYLNHSAYLKTKPMDTKLKKCYRKLLWNYTLIEKMLRKLKE